MEEKIISALDAFIALVYDCCVKNTYRSIAIDGKYHLSLAYDFLQIPVEYANFIMAYILVQGGKKRDFQSLSTLFQKYVQSKSELVLNDSERIAILEHQMCRLQQRNSALMGEYLEEKKNRRKEEADLKEEIEALKRKQEHLWNELASLQQWIGFRIYHRVAGTVKRFWT